MEFEKDVTLNFDENVIFYEVEENDDAETVLAAMTEDERKAIEDHNNKFLAEKVEENIKATFNVCACQMPLWIQRNESRRSLLNLDPRVYQPTINQKEFDASNYSVVAIAKDGKLEGIAAVVRECKCCHAINIFGSCSTIGNILAGAITNDLNHPMTEVGVELTDDNIEAIFGEGAFLSDVEEPTETQN